MNAMTSDLPRAQLTAGAYLRKRRLAAGLTIDAVTAATAPGATSNRTAFAQRLAAIEADKDAAAEPTIWILKGAFHFDAEIYRNLAAGLPAGTALCRHCACSWNDACIGAGANCHWAESDLCSGCAGSSAPIDVSPAQEPSFTLKASDRHAIPVLAILASLRLGKWEHARRELEDAIANDRRQFLLDMKGGQNAAAAALEMTAWRHPGADALVARGVVHG